MLLLLLYGYVDARLIDCCNADLYTSSHPWWCAKSQCVQSTPHHVCQPASFLSILSPYCLSFPQLGCSPRGSATGPAAVSAGNIFFGFVDARLIARFNADLYTPCNAQCNISQSQHFDFLINGSSRLQPAEMTSVHFSFIHLNCVLGRIRSQPRYVQTQSASSKLVCLWQVCATCTQPQEQSGPCACPPELCLCDDLWHLVLAIESHDCLSFPQFDCNSATGLAAVHTTSNDRGCEAHCSHQCRPVHTLQCPLEHFTITTLFLFLCSSHLHPAGLTWVEFHNCLSFPQLGCSPRGSATGPAAVCKKHLMRICGCKAHCSLQRRPWNTLPCPVQHFTVNFIYLF